MITNSVQGNLIEKAKAGEFFAIVHGCNCFHTMGSGIAKAIRNEFPEIYNVDKTTRKGDPKKLGSYSVLQTNVSEENKRLLIFNAYTQYYHGTKEQHVSYEAIGSVFLRINDDFANRKWTALDDPRLVNIGIPKIGCGLAGGDWDVVSSIIDHVTPDINITVVTL